MQLIEDEELLIIGKNRYDVSNVSMFRKQIARRAWNEYVKNMSEDKDFNEDEFDNIIDNYGLFLIRQDLLVLKRRMPLLKAITSYIKRHLLTIKKIRSYNEDQYKGFQDWAFYNITGTKKKELQVQKEIQSLEAMAMEELKKVAPDLETQMELLRIFLAETAGRMNTLQPLAKAQ